MVERGIQSVEGQVRVMKSDTKAANISGDEAPAAMKVAPATSSGMLSTSQSTFKAGTKKSSTTTAKPQNDMSMRITHTGHPYFPNASSKSTPPGKSSEYSVGAAVGTVVAAVVPSPAAVGVVVVVVVVVVVASSAVQGEHMHIVTATTNNTMAPPKGDGLLLLVVELVL